MYQRPVAEDTMIDPEIAPSPLRGLLIAVPVAVALWVGVVELAAYFF